MVISLISWPSVTALCSAKWKFGAIRRGRCIIIAAKTFQNRRRRNWKWGRNVKSMPTHCYSTPWARALVSLHLIRYFVKPTLGHANIRLPGDDSELKSRNATMYSAAVWEMSFWFSPRHLPNTIPNSSICWVQSFAVTSGEKLPHVMALPIVMY